MAPSIILTRGDVAKLVSLALDDLNILRNEHPEMSVLTDGVQQILQQGLRFASTTRSDDVALAYLGSTSRAAAELLRYAATQRPEFASAGVSHGALTSLVTSLESMAAVITENQKPAPRVASATHGRG